MSDGAENRQHIKAPSQRPWCRLCNQPMTATSSTARVTYYRCVRCKATAKTPRVLFYKRGNDPQGS